MRARTHSYCEQAHRTASHTPRVEAAGRLSDRQISRERRYFQLSGNIQDTYTPLTTNHRTPRPCVPLSNPWRYIQLDECRNSTCPLFECVRKCSVQRSRTSQTWRRAPRACIPEQHSASIECAKCEGRSHSNMRIPIKDTKSLRTQK